MRIIFVSWWWPYPASNGSKIRIYNVLRRLAETHEVILFSFAQSDEATPAQVAHMQEFCQRVEVVPKPTFHPDSLRATAGYFAPWPRSLIDTYSEAMAEHVRDASTHADLLIASQLQTLRYVESAPDLPAILEEIEIVGFRDCVMHAHGIGDRLRAQLTLVKLESALRRLLQRGAVITVASDEERELLRHIAPETAQVVVISNGVDTFANHPADISPEPETLIYPGAITYEANYDAVAYFVHEVLPLVRQQIPNVRFKVTGDTGSVDIHDMVTQPGVTFSGYLPEIAPAVQASWATVVPLRMGGGTRLKILESMALGTPVISTGKGAAGLHVHPGEDILIADPPKAMAEAVCTLLGDEALRSRLAQAGRSLVEHDYDWTMISHQFIHLAEDLTASRAARHDQ